MARRFFLSALITLIGFFGLAVAQDSTVYIRIEGPTTPPCEDNRLDFPVYMTNPVTVGGFSIEIMLTDPSWFEFDPDDLLAVDTIGACHTTWGNFDFYVHPYGHKITVTALGPGGQNLPPGENCLIFTIHGDFDNKLVSDTCQLINFGTTSVADSTGYINLPRILVRDSLCVEACDTNLVRGDANQSGALNGLDVTYLIIYFKGGSSICLGCPCLADANNDGNVNGLDVVFLVSYFKGGTAPDPPNCPE
ncbi:MAG: dockerin type I repeat-containing protein [Candidatus Zixiibacteriota bacterium]|nr:MAG: dockerin type I repeat-containing protein [candidate division Zixibacteria bacterium]